MGRTVIKTINIIVAAIGIFAAGYSPAATQPNILFIHVDDMDFDEIGCYDGRGKVLTPNMDRLAAEGMKFTRAYINSAVCVPSRYSTLTGKYVGHNNRFASEIPVKKTISYENVEKEGKSGAYIDVGGGEKTVAHYLKELGYRTGMVGKYHNDRISLKRPYLNFGDNAADPETARKLKEHYNQTLARVKKQTGFDVVDRLYWENKEAFPVKEIQFDNTPWITEGAVQFIRESKDKPFFLYYSNPLPHGIAVNEKYKGRSNPHTDVNMSIRDARATPEGMLEKIPDIQPSREDVIRRVNEADTWGESTAEMTWLDDSIGALLDTLGAEGIADNTVVVLLSDHQSSGKRTLYDIGIRVPMLVCWPGQIPPGSVCDELVANIDLVPTFIAMAGGDPAGRPALNGFSLLSLFKGGQEPVRENLLLEFGFARGVVSKDWKYIALRFPPYARQMADNDRCIWDGSTRGSQKGLRQKFPAYSEPDQLYDLRKDPGEQNNLFNHPELQPTARNMQAELKNYLQKMPHHFGEFK